MTIKYALIFSKAMEYPRYIQAKNLHELFELFQQELTIAFEAGLGELELVYRIY